MLHFLFVLRFNFEVGTPPTNFDTFAAAIMTVFQVSSFLLPTWIFASYNLHQKHDPLYFSFYTWRSQSIHILSFIEMKLNFMKLKNNLEVVKYFTLLEHDVSCPCAHLSLCWEHLKLFKKNLILMTHNAVMSSTHKMKPLKRPTAEQWRHLCDSHGFRCVCVWWGGTCTYYIMKTRICI